MREAVIGLVAPVDAGKTTLAEALLYHAGAIRRQGRVDHGDSFLDADEMERRRGITIFSKQAILDCGDLRITLLDTPGHVDFVAETERALWALDYAILVIGANDGVSGHAETLWRLLARREVPTFVFVNKTDLAAASPTELLGSLRQRLGDDIVEACSLLEGQGHEQAALTDEAALDEFLASERLSRKTLRRLVAQRRVFPCFFGSALHGEGVAELLGGIEKLVAPISWPDAFAARVYKVSHDRGGSRIAWLKLTGGSLAAKDSVRGVSLGEPWTDKVHQLRMYNGERYELVSRVTAGSSCAVTGLSHVLAGDVLGAQEAPPPPRLAPVLSYRVAPVGCDVHAVHEALLELAAEDPMLAVSWRDDLQELGLRLMGTMQLEVVRELLSSRHGLAVEFGPGSILYKETIRAPAMGIGHFEPLRHYAEVHVLLEPAARGAGISFGTVCPEDDLDRNWQRLALTNAMEREHVGTLVGAPVTDLRVTLVAGRAHARHTEGGDFRQATYRAIRNALMQAACVLLEPWYRFWLVVPDHAVGRALADIQRMGASFSAPAGVSDMVSITGRIPASEVGDYPATVSAYTSGRGSLALEFAGYDECHDAQRVIAEAAYDPVADLPNTPDSVFCRHGAGFVVAWGEVANFAHLHPDPQRRRTWREADASFFSSR